MQTSSSVRKRLRPAQRDKILASYQRSGLSQREFASRRGIGLSTLQLWQRKAAGPKGFIQLPNVLAQSSASAVYRLHLGQGRLLEIGSGFRTEELAALLPLLRQL